MKERLIELFHELTEEERQIVIDYIEHPINRETPVAEATGISLDGVFM